MTNPTSIGQETSATDHDTSVPRGPIETSVDTPEGKFSISFDPTTSAAPQTSASTGTEHRVIREEGISHVAEGSNGASGSGGDGGDGGGSSSGSGDDGSSFSQLKGVPIEYLVATPLIASARANMALAQVMSEFIDTLAFRDKKTRLIEFDLTREYQDPVTKSPKEQTVRVRAPLIALVPIPALLIQSVTVDLTVEISQTTASNNSSTVSANLNVSAGWGWGSASFTGSYSNTQSNTRSTNQSAKYEVTVNAQQQPAPEGMSRLMDVFAATITPIPLASGGGPS